MNQFSNAVSYSSKFEEKVTLTTSRALSVMATENSTRQQFADLVWSNGILGRITSLPMACTARAGGQVTCPPELVNRSPGFDDPAHHGVLTARSRTPETAPRDGSKATRWRNLTSRRPNQSTARVGIFSAAVLNGCRQLKTLPGRARFQSRLFEGRPQCARRHHREDSNWQSGAKTARGYPA